MSWNFKSDQNCFQKSPKFHQIVPKCVKNDPKMFQKCSKNVPKMFQKCSQNVPKMLPKCFKISPKLVQNRSKIDAKINSKIDAKFVFQKSIKNRALERQRVAKVTSALQRLEVSGLEGSPGPIENRTLWPKDPPERIPTRRWAEGLANLIIN